jgi:putative transcriptional regulator
MTKTAKKEKYGALLTEALNEAIAIKEGRARAAKTRRIAVSASDAVVTPPPVFSAKRIRSIRQTLALSQAIFARVLNVSDSTVKAWEQGLRQPSGATCRLLELAEERPEFVVSLLAEKDGQKTYA